MNWAIVDVTVPPDAERPGGMVAAGFFDESWQLPAETGHREKDHLPGE